MASTKVRDVCSLATTTPCSTTRSIFRISLTISFLGGVGLSDVVVHHFLEFRDVGFGFVDTILLLLLLLRTAPSFEVDDATLEEVVVVPPRCT